MEFVLNMNVIVGWDIQVNGVKHQRLVIFIWVGRNLK